MAWVSSKCKKRSYVTLHSLCICRQTLTCNFCKISTSHEKGWLILTGLPSLLLDPISCRLVSAAVRCRLPTAPLRRQLTTLASFFQLFDLRSLVYFRYRGDLDSKPIVWFRAKTDKGIVCLANHPQNVTP